MRSFLKNAITQRQDFRGRGPRGLNVLGLVALLLLSACSTADGVTFHTDDGKVNVAVEVADTNEERSQGLMYRESLPENAGMLFIFNEEAPRTFWMKNTLIPLDIIFIGADMVVDQVTTAQPCATEQCPIYPSVQPAQYVVEVNAGFAHEHGIAAGDTVEIRI